MKFETGADIRRWRESQGIKQGSLAEVMGITQEYLCRVERQDRPLSVTLQWVLWGISRYVGEGLTPPAFVCKDYYVHASTRRTPIGE